MHLNFLLLKSISISSLFFLWGNSFFHRPLVVLYNAIYDTHVNPNINNYTHCRDESFIMHYSIQHTISDSYTFLFRNCCCISLLGPPWQWKRPWPSLCLHVLCFLYSSVLLSSYKDTGYIGLVKWVKLLSRVRLFATPWTPGSSVHGIF